MKNEKSPLLSQPGFFQPANKNVVEGKEFLLDFTELTKLAESGNPNAQLLLGLAYLRGLNECVCNSTIAWNWIEQVAKEDTIPAGLCAKGLCYECGRGGILVKNIDKAKEYYLQAIEKNFIPAMHEYATVLYEEERNFKSDTHTSFTSSKGDLITGETKTQHINESRREMMIRLFTTCAEEGYTVSQVELSICYFHGFGVKQDYQQSYRLIQKGVESGSGKAKKYMGHFYSLAIYVEQDIQKAVDLYKAAQKQGYDVDKELETYQCCCCTCSIL